MYESDILGLKARAAVLGPLKSFQDYLQLKDGGDNVRWGLNRSAHETVDIPICSFRACNCFVHQIRVEEWVENRGE